MKIKAMKDFNAGLMFMAFGLLFVGVAKGWFGGNGYPMGTAVRMGPAYFPMILGGITFLLGAITFVKSFIVPGEDPSPTQWRPLVWIIGAVIVFSLIVGPFNGGLIVASIAIVILAAYGGFEFKPVETMVSSVVLTAACVGIFHYGLGLPFKLFPWS